MRSRIAAEVVRQFMDLYESFPEKRYLEEYRRYSCLIGKEIRVIPTEQITGSVEEAERAASPIFGKVLSIDENCRLMVAYEDGSCELLSSGEVSVRER
jgi:BirA family biotin operon repressor/biotin-[acetyl-CoA-carboxylase] ligase